MRSGTDRGSQSLAAHLGEPVILTVRQQPALGSDLDAFVQLLPDLDITVQKPEVLGGVLLEVQHPAVLHRERPGHAQRFAAAGAHQTYCAATSRSARFRPQ